MNKAAALLALLVLSALVGCVVNYAARGSHQTVDGDRTVLGGTNVRKVDIDLAPR